MSPMCGRTTINEFGSVPEDTSNEFGRILYNVVAHHWPIGQLHQNPRVLDHV